MRATFTPTLNSTVNIPVTAAGTAKAVRVTLTALVDSDEYEREVCRGGAKLEVWTDAPSGEGDNEPIAAGQRGWRAVEFKEVLDGEGNDAASIKSVKHEAGVPTLRLSPAEPSKSPQVEPPQHRAYRTFRTTLLVPRTPPWRYAFTYRVVYPSHTRWLGSPETNGRLEVVESDLGFEEISPDSTHGGWRAGGKKIGGGRLWSATCGEVGAKGVTVGTLDIRTWDWKGWAISEAGAVTFFSLAPSKSQSRNQYDVKHARIVYLVPSFHIQASSSKNENLSDSIVAPRPIVLRTYTSAMSSTSSSNTSPLPSLSVSPQGSVSISCEPSAQNQNVFANGDANTGSSMTVTVERRTHDPTSDDDVRAFVTSMRSAGPRTLEALDVKYAQNLGAKSGPGVGYLGFAARHQQGNDSETNAESGTAEIYVVPTIHHDLQRNLDKVQTLEVALEELARVCGPKHGSNSTICLFCQETQSSVVFNLEERDKNVRVSVREDGGEFLVCPVYELSKPENGNDTSTPWVKIAVPFITGKAEVITTRSLPTPPASPPPRAVTFGQGKKDGTATPKATPKVTAPANNDAVASPEPPTAATESRPVLEPTSGSSAAIPTGSPSTPTSAQCTELTRHWRSHMHLPARIFAAFSLVTWIVRVLLYGLWGIVKLPPIAVGRGVGWVGAVGMRTPVNGNRRLPGEGVAGTSEVREEEECIRRPDSNTPPNGDAEAGDAHERGGEDEALSMRGPASSDQETQLHPQSTAVDRDSVVPLSPLTPTVSSLASTHVNPSKALKWQLPFDPSIDKKEKIAILVVSPIGDESGGTDIEALLSRLQVEVNGWAVELAGRQAVEGGVTLAEYVLPTPLVKSGGGVSGAVGDGNGSFALNTLTVRMD